MLQTVPLPTLIDEADRECSLWGPGYTGHGPGPSMDLVVIPVYTRYTAHGTTLSVTVPPPALLQPVSVRQAMPDLVLHSTGHNYVSLANITHQLLKRLRI